MRVSLVGILFFLLPITGIANFVLHTSHTNGRINVKTWKSFRDDSIEKQDLDYSCGSAATATILRSFYNEVVTENDILIEVEKVGLDGTASFSDLQQAVDKFGYKGIGLSMSFEKLKTLKIPAIVYLRYRDNDHFSVVRGIATDGTVWLGDPSWGNRQFSEFQFKRMWEIRNDEKLKGKVLLYIPKNKVLASIEKDFFYPPNKNRAIVELLSIRYEVSKK